MKNCNLFCYCEIHFPCVKIILIGNLVTMRAPGQRSPARWPRCRNCQSFSCDRFDVREKRYECKLKIVINHSINVDEERGTWSLLIHRPISRRTDVTPMASLRSVRFPHLVRRLILHTHPQVHRRAKSECEGQDVVFDTTLLDYIVCPVSKKPLR